MLLDSNRCKNCFDGFIEAEGFQFDILASLQIGYLSETT